MKQNQAGVGFVLRDAMSHRGGVLPLHVYPVVEIVPTPIRVL